MCNIEHLINLLHIWWGLFSTWQFFKTIIQVKVTLRIRPPSPLSPQTASLQESYVCLDGQQSEEEERSPWQQTPLESHSTSSLGALQGPGLAVIIVSMTMRHAQCISASSDKQWSFTKTRRSLRQLVKSMLRVSQLIKPSSLSSDTVSIVPRRLSTARWLEWNAHQSESWAGLMIPCAAY